MLKKLFSFLENLNEKQKKISFILSLGILGIFIMLLPSFRPNSAQPTIVNSQKKFDSQEIKTIQDYEKLYEKELIDILSKVVGVSEVSAVVNLDSSEEEVVAVDVQQTEQLTNELDKRGGNRSISQNSNNKKTAYYRTENGEKPVVIKKIKPKVRGVLIVARGVENLQVKALVIEAVQRVLDVPIHHISVLPKG